MTLCVCIGLYRLQNIHAAAAALAEDSVLLPPSFVAVRATGIADFHASLRRIDASHVSSRFGDYPFSDRSKCIVLDFSTTEALTTILRQVNQSVTSLINILYSCKKMKQEEEEGENRKKKKKKKKKRNKNKQTLNCAQATALCRILQLRSWGEPRDAPCRGKIQRIKSLICVMLMKVEK